jgi:hypothetical protein
MYRIIMECGLQSGVGPDSVYSKSQDLCTELLCILAAEGGGGGAYETEFLTAKEN